MTGERPSPALVYKRHYDRIKYRIKRRGVPLLNLRQPGWRDRIGSQFHVEDHHRCLLAHLYPSYREGIRELSGLEEERELLRWSVQHGFDAYIGEPYEILNRAWHNELNRRGRETAP